MFTTEDLENLQIHKEQHKNVTSYPRDLLLPFECISFQLFFYTHFYIYSMYFSIFSINIIESTLRT